MEKKRLPDTPWHMGYAKKEESDPRRHKSRCVYLQDGICKSRHDGCYMQKCGGSSHCMHYSETLKEETEEEIDKNSLEVSVRDNFAHLNNMMKMEKTYYRGKPYYKIHLSEEESLMVPYEPKITKGKIQEYIRSYYQSKR